MCLAIPGQIININGRSATIKYPSETREVLMSEVPVVVGDYALVQMGVIIQKISAAEASDSLKAWQELTV